MRVNVGVTKNGITNVYSAESGETVLDILRRENIFIPAFCGGNKLCGKCKVIVRGTVSEPTDEERQILSETELRDCIRLACCVKVLGEVKVTIQDDSEYSVLTNFDGQISSSHITCGEEIGLAIDLGTTTIAMYAYSLDMRRCVGVVSDVNHQQQFGADVISRIDYCIKNGTEGPNNTIISQLNELIAKLQKKYGIAEKNVKSVAVAGNTAMLYMLSNKSPLSISAAPFVADCLFGSFVSAKELGLDLSRAMVYMIPSISAYIGGDITAGILASGIDKTDENKLFIDFGTNGEMVLASNGKLYCCSTAAGPAFEGANISCGCGGVSGAVKSVYNECGDIKVISIGKDEPCGLAGSGLLDLAAVLSESGIISENGYMENSFEFAKGLELKPQDIRELQLAKSAIRAGIDVLMDAAKITSEDLDEVILTGGFGVNMNPGNAAKIGLIPEVSYSKLKLLGNCAGAGAVKTLLEPESLDKFRKIKDIATVIDLNESEIFQEKYIEYMGFGKLVTAAVNDSNMILHGRYNKEKSFRANWVNSGIEFKVTGDSAYVDILVGDIFPNYNPFVQVWIDGKRAERIMLIPGYKTYCVATGLSIEEHTVKVLIVTELYTDGYHTTVDFINVSASGENASIIPIKPDEKALKFDFYGDSITCGFGTIPGYLPGYRTQDQDSSLSYAFRTADHFGGYGNYIAISGWACYEAYGDRNARIPRLWRYISDADHTEFDFSRKADIVIVALGTNDAWSWGDKPIDLFKESYLEFLKNIRQEYPKAYIFCIHNMMDKSFSPVIKEISEKFSQEDEMGAEYVEMPNMEGNDEYLGSGWHPSGTFGAEASKYLIDAVNKKYYNK